MIVDADTDLVLAPRYVKPHGMQRSRRIARCAVSRQFEEIRADLACGRGLGGSSDGLRPSDRNRRPALRRALLDAAFARALRGRYRRYGMEPRHPRNLAVKRRAPS